MKKTFYEVLWDLCEHEGLVQHWKDSGLLSQSDSRLTWHPKVADILEKEDLIVVGKLTVTPKEEVLEVLEVLEIPEVPEINQELAEPTNLPLLKVNSNSKEIPWIKEFIVKFSARNIGITAKTTDVGTVQAKMNKFMTKYKYTKEEILGATDLYIDTLRRKGSLTYIRECGYFISKRIDGIDQSDLANWCEQFKDNGNQSTGYSSRHLI